MDLFWQAEGLPGATPQSIADSFLAHDLRRGWGGV